MQTRQNYASYPIILCRYIALLVYFIMHRISNMNILQVNSQWLNCSRRVIHSARERFRSAMLAGPLTHDIELSCPTSTFASNRIMQSVCVVDTDLYLFGGCTSTQTTFNDLWKICLQDKKMQRVQTRSCGNCPSPKSHATLVAWKNLLVLFGGWSSPCSYPLHQQGYLFDELHTFNIEDNMWTARNMLDSPPPAAGHTATLHEDVIVFFGGLQKSDSVSVSTNKVYCLDMRRLRWFKPNISEAAPSPRYGHSQFKVDNQHLVIMSGCGGYNDLRSDIWLLTIPSNIYSSEQWVWTQLSEEGMENMPKKVWCSPACLVDDNIVVLSHGKEPKKEMLPKSRQEFHKSSQCEIPTKSVLEKGSIPQEANSASHSKPSIRRNAHNQAELRNFVLDKYANRLEKMNHSKNEAPPHKNSTSFSKETKPACRQSVYILSLKTALTDGTVRWLPGPTSCVDDLPLHPRLLSSLVVGRAELILCGGKKAKECDCDPADSLPPVVCIKTLGPSPP